ncbi:MAG: Tryptophan synthase beta chain, partial [uncultured Solirubrobacteraceae bacterium]
GRRDASRGALRSLRGPLRARDADPRPRGRRVGVDAGARRRRLPGGAGAPAARLRRAPDSALPRGAVLRAGGPARLLQARGPAPHRRPQDQQRDRAVPARPPHGQAAHHRRDGRRPARRGDGDRLRAARTRVHHLHGHRGHAPPAAQRAAHAAARSDRLAGGDRLAHAQGGGVRCDPRLGGQRGEHPLRDRLGGRARAVPRARPRSPAGDRRRGAGPGARALRRAARAGRRLRGRRLQCHRDLHRVRRGRRRRARRRRGGRRGAGLGTPRRAADRRRPRRHPARLVLGHPPGRRGPDRRRALDLGRSRLPGRRTGARLAARQRARSLRRRLRRRRPRRAARLRAHGGDHPGAGVLPRDRVDLGRRSAVSRRLRPGLPVRTRRQGPRRSPRPPV